LQLVAAMTADDSASASAIAAYTKQLGGLAHSIAAWRGAVNGNTREWERCNATLGAEKARLSAQHRALKADSHHLSTQHSARLKALCLARQAALYLETY